MRAARIAVVQSGARTPAISRFLFTLASSIALFAVAAPARAESPCAAREAANQAKLREAQADAALAAHLANKPKDADPAWQKASNQIDARIYQLGEAVKIAKKNLAIANMEFDQNNTQLINANVLQSRQAARQTALAKQLTAQKRFGRRRPPG